MDSNSDYETGHATTETSTAVNICSMKTLIRYVEEFQRLDQVETMRRLGNENSSLHLLISQHQQRWCAILDMLEQADGALVTMTTALGKSLEVVRTAEAQWLAFWGIEADHTGPSESCPVVRI